MKHINSKYILWLVVMLAAIGQMTNTIYVPAMGMMAHDLHVLPTRVQSIMALYLLAYGISQFVYGPLSDFFGRKPVIIIGVIIFLIGTLLAVTASIFPHVMIGSFVQGIGIGVGGVMARTVMRDLFSGRDLHKAASYISVALVFAPLLAPVIGGILAGWFGWRSGFVFLFVFGVIVLLTQYFFFSETNQHIRNPDNSIANIQKSYFTVLSNPQFIGYMVCLFVSFGGVSVFESSAGILFTNVMHFSPQVTSLLFIIPLPGYLFGSYLAGRLCCVWSLDRIMLTGIVILTVGAVFMLASGMLEWVNAFAILISASLYLFGVGILFPTANAGALEPFAKLAGTAGALLGGMQNVGAGVAIMVSATMRQTSQIPQGRILLSLSILVIVAYLYFVRKNNVEPKHRVSNE